MKQLKYFRKKTSHCYLLAQTTYKYTQDVLQCDGHLPRYNFNMEIKVTLFTAG